MARALQAMDEIGKSLSGKANKCQADMTQADRGFRPAFNAQLAADTQTMIITGSATLG